MLIITKSDFNVNDFFKINFNTINIRSVNPIFYENITYNYMQQLFNFEELNSYAFCDFLDQNYMDIIYNPKHKETQEYKNFQKYEQEQIELGNYNKMQCDNSLYWYYSNNYAGVVSEMINQQLMFKHYFSNFGWQWYILNYNFDDSYAVKALDYTYPVNETFLLTLDNMVTPMGFLKNGEIHEFNEQYEFGCMLDLLMNLDSYSNYCVQSSVISVPKIKYNTSYKCRLNKINKHE